MADGAEGGEMSKQKRGEERQRESPAQSTLQPQSIWSPTPCLWPGYRRNGVLWHVIMVNWVWRARGSLSFPFFLPVYLHGG